MIVVLLVVVFFIVLAVVVRRVRKRRLAAAAPVGPLAGYDTGVRSPYRVPGSKLFGPRRGF